MSFSSNIKQDFCKNIPNNIEILKYEVLGYLLSGNTREFEDKFIFVTENEFNVERFYKILFRLNIMYEPNKDGKNYEAIIDKNYCLNNIFLLTEFEKEDFAKAIIRGCFLGSGSITNPEYKYHLEINFNDEKKAKFIISICNQFDLNVKLLNKNNKYLLYIKEGEEISNLLAFIGANNSVLKFEEIRVVREMKNNINRKVNCETANLNKTIDAAVNVIEDINYIKAKNKFDELGEQQKELCNLRIENPEMSLKDLGNLLKDKVGKSGVKYRLDKIHKIAEELREENVGIDANINPQK